MKKLLAVLVALAMVLAMLAVCEAAEPTNEKTAEPAKKDMDKKDEAKPAAAAVAAAPAVAPKAAQTQMKVVDGKATVKIDDKKQLTVGADKWTGPDDCSAVATIEKTDVGIVATIKVTDDKLVFEGPAEATHQSDGIEFYLDERPVEKRGKAYYDKGVVQIQVMPGLGDKPDVVKINTGGETYTGDIPGIKTESKKTAKGYEIKLTIPAEGLAKNHCPLGDSFAFDISVNDADSGPDRDSQIMAFGTNDNWQNPSAFAVVDFGKK